MIQVPGWTVRERAGTYAATWQDRLTPEQRDRVDESTLKAAGLATSLWYAGDGWTVTIATRAVGLGDRLRDACDAWTRHVSEILDISSCLE